MHPASFGYLKYIFPLAEFDSFLHVTDSVSAWILEHTGCPVARAEEFYPESARLERPAMEGSDHEGWSTPDFESEDLNSDR